MRKLGQGIIIASRARRIAAALMLFITAAFHRANGQEGTWSISGSAGGTFLNLKDVDNDNTSDVEIYNRVGIPLPPFPAFDRAWFFSGRISYRYARDFGLSLLVTYFDKRISTKYDTPEEILSLARSVGSTDAMLAFAYYPPVRPYFLDWYTELLIGFTFARAWAEAYGATFPKIDGVPTVQVNTDTKGVYNKSKIAVGIGLGASARLVGSLILRADAAYKFAQLGKIDGEVTRFGVTASETTTPEFNFSAIFVSAGLGVEF